MDPTARAIETRLHGHVILGGLGCVRRGGRSSRGFDRPQRPTDDPNQTVRIVLAASRDAVGQRVVDQVIEVMRETLHGQSDSTRLSPGDGGFVEERGPQRGQPAQGVAGREQHPAIRAGPASNDRQPLFQWYAGDGLGNLVLVKVEQGVDQVRDRTIDRLGGDQRGCQARNLSRTVGKGALELCPMGLQDRCYPMGANLRRARAITGATVGVGDRCTRICGGGGLAGGHIRSIAQGCDTEPVDP